MHVIYVDDEKPAIDNFRLTTEKFSEIRSLETFQSGAAALEYVREHTVDVAFLDMEMPGLHGLSLAQEIKAHDERIRVIFVTAYSQYALDAWGVDASGYLLKPYTAAEIHRELAKCTYRYLPSSRVVIETIPNLSVTVDGAPFHVPGAKTREMLAFLIDRGERGFSVGEGIACLWPDRAADAGTQSLCRMTWKRLMTALEAAGIGDIVVSSDNRRYLKTDQVECDLYRLLAGDEKAKRKYNGEYLSEYEWAEERNAQLHWMLHK